MPYLETVQELLDDGTSLSTNLVLSWNELRTNLRVACRKLATNLRLTCDLTRKISIQVVGGIYRYGKTDFQKTCCFAAQKQSPQHPRNLCRRGHDDQQIHPQQP